MGFDINTANPELNWNMAKGKRSRKSMARSMNGVATGSNLSNPRGGDFSGSDSDKFGGVVTGQSTFVKSGGVPIKKRRHLLQPPSSLTWTPLGCPERGDNAAGDFSGIELLAAAASMDEFINDTRNGNLAVEHSLNLKNSDTSSSAPHCEEGLKINESEISLGNMTVNGGNTDDSLLPSNSPSVSQSPCGKPIDMTIPKVNRRHWDLNALMETWDLPYDDSISGNTSDDEMHIEDMRNTFNVARDLSYKKDNDADAGEANQDQIVSGGFQKDASDLAMHANALVDTSLSKLDPPPSGGLISSEDKVSVAMNHGEACSSNLSDSERTTNSVIQTVSQDIDDNHMPACEISETTMDVECKDLKDSWKACEASGAIIQGGQSVLSSDSRILGQVELSEVFAAPEDNKLPNDGSRSIVLEDSCKSSVGGGQCGDPTSSTGKIGSSIADQHDSDVSQNHNYHNGDGDGLTKYQDVDDSPYEDGELRGSFLFSCEENELDDDCVDYESDGRNGDGSDTADNPDSATFEGGSGVSDVTQRGNPFAKQLPKGNGGNSGSVKQYLNMHFVKDVADNNERAGEGSTAGSGTRVKEEPMDVNFKKNDDFVEGRRLSYRRVIARMLQMNEYESNTVRGKFGSSIQGWSSLDSTYGKDDFMQEHRSHRFNDLYSRPERDICPDKRLGRYRLPIHGEKDEVYPSRSWISRRRYSSCQGAEDRSYSRPRNITGVSDKMGGQVLYDSRQASIYSKGLGRPFMRSPEGRVDYFGTRSRTLPSKQGADNYRIRGNHLLCTGRDFVEHFELLHDEANIPVQLSHYLSTNEQRFSPVSRRSPHIGLPCKRSLSKSRTGSSGPGHPHKEQILRSRRHSRSPDFRSGAQIERTRMPFSKPSTPNFRQDCISPSRRHFSPLQPSFRWVDNGGFASNHSGHNKSPVRVFRQRTQRFADTVGSGQMKSDECFRPMFHP